LRGCSLGVTSGVYDNTLDLTLISSYNPNFLNFPAIGSNVAAAESALIAGIAGAGPT
jgi:hypothetical protein